jgi:AcrR family transcriptional regulator
MKADDQYGSPARRGRPRGAAAVSRERNLDAAIDQFSKSSYDETGLRDIAAAAAVDVAYVHRLFGSKKQLFAEAVSTAVRPKELFTGPADNLPYLLALDLLAHRGRRLQGIEIIVRSISSREAGPIVRDFMMRECIKPLSANLDDDATKAAVIGALVTGVAILRNVVSLDPLREPEGGKLERLLAHVFESATEFKDVGRQRRKS